ncbi:hypothetical protein IPM62_04740 [Candidatus Woesebacteria bacterium]|nr:MAG: hypothetical protein IPM62_04740 [Candidatus Woesebacteria bacterium]
MLKKLQKICFRKINYYSLILIIVASTAWSTTMVKSGYAYTYGLGFWGANGHDGIWHIAVIESLLRGSLNMPIFSGEPLQNYHLGFDIIIAVLHKLTFIPVITLYFQLVPILMSLGIGYAVYRFVLNWKKSHLAAFFSTFFVYFGGSLGWIITLIKTGSFDGESTFWSQQSISTLINPPFALSILIIFVGLNSMLNGVSHTDKKSLTMSTLLFGILISIKVYAGILVLFALFCSGMYKAVIAKKGINVLKIFSGALIVSLIVFLPFVNLNTTTIVWSPFWFLETMMQLSDRVGWEKFGAAMVNYKLAGNWINGLIFYGFSLVLFIVGNLGTRIIGLGYITTRLFPKNKTDFIDIFMISLILLGIIFPLFFVQSGTPWNTIQFFYYVQIFAGVFAGIELATLINKKTVISVVLGLCVILFTLPTTITTLLYVYIPHRPPAMLPLDELSALKYLSRQEEGVVLTYPFDQKAASDAISNPPRPLYLYESTAYVSALSKHDVYLEDEVNLNITGYDWPARRKEVDVFINTLNQNDAQDFLRRNNIKYIYWVNGQRAKLGETQLGLIKIFENKSVNIYKVINQ